MPLIDFSGEAPPSLSDQVALFHNLAQYMKSGIPLTAGFAHARELSSKRMGAILKGMQESIEVRHTTLTEAFRSHYPGRDGFLLAVIERGEASGTLEASFRQLERVAKAKLDRRRQLIREMAYPLLCFIAFLLLWPVPHLVKHGTDAYLIRAVPPFVVLFVLGFFFIFQWPKAKVDPALGRRLDGIRVGLPVVGRPIRASIQARFGRALALLVRTGMNMDRALELAGEASGSPLLAMRVSLLADDLRRGNARPLSEMLAPLTDILAPSFLGMLKTGEQTGEIDTMLEKAADLYEEEAQAALDVALKMAGPALNLVVIVGIAAYVINTYQGYLDQLGSIR
jgi:type II secretory pathway component PulF